MTEIATRLAALETRVGELEDLNAIRRLQMAYGYYIDYNRPEEVAGLFAQDGAVVFLSGEYRGAAGVMRLYGTWFQNLFTGGRRGPVDGLLLDHFQLQDVITIAPDRQTAKGRFRGILAGGWHDATRDSLPAGMPQQFWEAGIYENDFGITPDYLVLHIVPSIGSWERLEKGLPHFGFDTTMPVYLGIIPRRAGLKQDDIRWFKRDNCFASHVMNAFQEGTRVHIDVPEARNNMFPFFPDVHGAKFNGQEAMSHLTRWTVDMASNTDAFDAITPLTGTAGEFPRIDDRFTGLPYRHGWMLEMDYRRPVELKGGSAGGLLMNCLCHIDHATGTEQHWWCGPVSSLQEPCFIPRQADAAEGDGWIVQVCNRLDEHRSDLLIFEALNVAQGPVATIHIPIRLRFGLHGNWADGAAVGL